MDAEKTPPTIYSNSVSLKVTPWDFKMTFGELIDATQDPIEVDEKVVVYMSPQHTKAFTAVLVNNLAEYEKAVGKIPTVSVQEKPEDGGKESV